MTVRRLWCLWILSRALLALLVVHPHLLGAQQDVLGDVRLYEGWGHGLVHGAGLPSGDDRWQYPPGAAVVLAVPSALNSLVGLPYLAGLLALLIAVDAGVTAALDRWRGRPAAVFWTVGILALGPVALARFDMVPAALAVAGLLAAAGTARPGNGRRARLAGFALGLGGLVKLWPALLLIPATAGRDRRTLSGLAVGVLRAVVTVAMVLKIFGWGRGAGDFLGAQKARGLQVESVPAVPFVVAHLVGAGPAPTYSYGSLQFDSPLARAVTTICLVVEVLIVMVVAAAWWNPWRRASRHEPDVAGRSLVLLLALVVTSRVLSPQYLVWLLAVAACRATPDAAPHESAPHDAVARRAAWRRVGTLLLSAALLSQVIYPMRYNDVVQGRVVAGLLLVVRNAVLVTACVLALDATGRRLRRRRSPRPDSAPATTTDPHPPACATSD